MACLAGAGFLCFTGFFLVALAGVALGFLVPGFFAARDTVLDLGLACFALDAEVDAAGVAWGFAATGVWATETSASADKRVATTRVLMVFMGGMGSGEESTALGCFETTRMVFDLQGYPMGSPGCR